MRLPRAALLAGGAMLAWAPSALSVEPITPPAMYPPDTWEGRSAALVRVLDKLDAHVETLSIPVGQSGGYKSLAISVRSCLQHPPQLAPDSAAFLTIQDGHADARPFAGWMFAAEPFVAVFESPVYGVQLVSCAGSDVAPAAPPLLPPPPPPGTASPPGPNAYPAAPPGSAAPPGPDAPPPDGGPDPVYPSGQPDQVPPAAPPSD